MFNTSGKINHGYSPLKQFCLSVVRVISSFDGDKDDNNILFFCVQNGWIGGHWSSLRMFYGRNHDLVDRYGISVSQMTTCRKHFPVLSSFVTFLRILIKRNSLVKIY